MSSEYQTSNIGISLQTLFRSSKCEQIKDLLSTLTSEDINSIALTASQKKIYPETKQEAIDVILLYTADLDRFFSYRRITSNVLTYYLHSNNFQIKGHATRGQLISNVYKVWARKFSEDSPSSASEKNIQLTSDKKNSSVAAHNCPIQSDVFAHDFAEWFYSCLNEINSDSSMRGASNLDSSMFCSNASVNMFLVNPAGQEEIHCEGDKNCEKAIRDIVLQHRLSFTPNLETGTQALQSPHGLIKVLSCGTLHVGRSFIGIFEQEFGLVQNPLDKNWKVFYTKMNLKEAVSEMPQLPPCAVFEINTD